MKNNKIFSLMLLSMISTVSSFAVHSDASIEDNSAQLEKRFIQAMNAFKKLSINYPTAQEIVEKIRELESDDQQSIQYLRAHPRLIKKAIRGEVLHALGASEDDIEEAITKTRGKQDARHRASRMTEYAPFQDHLSQSESDDQSAMNPNEFQEDSSGSEYSFDGADYSLSPQENLQEEAKKQKRNKALGIDAANMIETARKTQVRNKKVDRNIPEDNTNEENLVDVIFDDAEKPTSKEKAEVQKRLAKVQRELRKLL